MNASKINTETEYSFIVVIQNNYLQFTLIINLMIYALYVVINISNFIYINDPVLTNITSYNTDES